VAISGPIARRVIIEVTAPQAIRTVVAVRGTDGLDRNVQAAAFASKRVGATTPGAMALIA
jgi:hypothetical protein